MCTDVDKDVQVLRELRIPMRIGKGYFPHRGNLYTRITGNSLEFNGIFRFVTALIHRRSCKEGGMRGLLHTVADFELPAWEVSGVEIIGMFRPVFR